MDEAPIPGRDDGYFFNRVMGRYDAPAYVRRACQVQEAFDHLVSRCRQQREEWLSMVSLRLGLLRALAGAWDVLRPWLADEDQLRILRDLETALDPRLRHPVEATSSSRALRRALRELNESIERFNRRWQEFLRTVDLTGVNAVRDGYNRYYLLEKECALRSPRLARQGFRRLEPLTLEELVAILPPLRVPRLKG